MRGGELKTSRGGNRGHRSGRQTWATGAVVMALAALPLLAQQSAVRTGDQATSLPGDAARGRALFQSTRCGDCHRVGETGSRLGPDLSDIGNRRTPDVLERAIVAPDAEVLPEDRFVRLVTKEGASVNGRLLNQDAFSIQLINAEEQLKSYLKSNLREYTILEKGLMPSFEGKLTREQVADIVSYLASLKGAEK
jgi:putative heme-binding domain-containing protein